MIILKKGGDLYYFTVRARNGKTIVNSSYYLTRAAMMKGALALFNSMRYPLGQYKLKDMLDPFNPKHFKDETK